MIDLGDEVKDSITGFKGIVVAVTNWLHGCRRITVQPAKLSTDGKPNETHTFDEPQLILLKKKKVDAGRRDTGGPRPEPVTKNTPTR